MKWIFACKIDENTSVHKWKAGYFSFYKNKVWNVIIYEFGAKDRSYLTN